MSALPCISLAHVKKMLSISYVIWIHSESKSSEKDLAPYLTWRHSAFMTLKQAAMVEVPETWLSTQPFDHLRCGEADAHQVWLDLCHRAHEHFWDWKHRLSVSPCCLWRSGKETSWIGGHLPTGSSALIWAHNHFNNQLSDQLLMFCFPARKCLLFI